MEISPSAQAIPHEVTPGQHCWAVAGVTSVWALAASRARDWFTREPRRLDAMGVTGGMMMIGLGATLAATG